jgi:ferredoxin
VSGVPCWRDGGLDVAGAATVRCEPSGRQVTLVRGCTLLDAINQARLPVAQACDGVALCGFCRVRVLAGRDHLSPAGALESAILRSMSAAEDERLACCATVSGPVSVTTSYW